MELVFTYKKEAKESRQSIRSFEGKLSLPSWKKYVFTFIESEVKRCD